MNPRRCAQVTTALCGTVGLAGWVVASLTDLGSSGIGNAGAVPIDDSPSPIAEVVDAPQATALGNIAVASADAETVAELVTRSDAGKMVASDQPESIVEAALPDPPQVPPPMQVATANTPDPVLNDTKEAVSTIEIREECLVAEICIDRFLWALYQRTPKEDTIKELERSKVAVKRKGKMVTVVRSFTKLVDEDFEWKDPKAAERARMSMMDYVIGGMDRSFKLKLFHTLHAAEAAGLSPGITSVAR
jgi:hypothetical protein